MGLSEARRCDIWYNAHTNSKGEFVVKEALREVMSQFYTDGVPTDAIGRQRRFPDVRNCEIVTWDEEGEEDGIRIVPAWKWSIAK